VTRANPVLAVFAMSEIIGDVTMSALHTALSGLSLRQRTISDNIANIETPGFHAGRVDFESSLRAAMQDGTDPAQAQPSLAQSLEPTRLDGNNVNLDEETLAMSETQLRYQLVSQAVTDQFARLRTAIGSS
jgi:flagellar basal-body rod protein FlgB